MTRFFRRKGNANPAPEAAQIIAEIQTRRLKILRRILTSGSGNGRKDIEAHVQEVDLPALDDLFILGGEEV